MVRICAYLACMQACTVVGTWFFNVNTDPRKSFVDDISLVVVYYACFNLGEVLFGYLYRSTYRAIHMEARPRPRCH